MQREKLMSSLGLRDTQAAHVPVPIRTRTRTQPLSPHHHHLSNHAQPQLRGRYSSHSHTVSHASQDVQSAGVLTL